MAGRTTSPLQRSRDANAPPIRLNPLRDWTTDYEGKVNFLESTFDINGAIARTLIRLSVDWNRSNDTYLYGLVAGSPLAVPEQLPPVKNELLRGEIDVTMNSPATCSLGPPTGSTITRSRTSRSGRRR